LGSLAPPFCVFYTFTQSGGFFPLVTSFVFLTVAGIFAILPTRTFSPFFFSVFFGFFQLPIFFFRRASLASCDRVLCFAWDHQPLASLLFFSFSFFLFFFAGGQALFLFGAPRTWGKPFCILFSCGRPPRHRKFFPKNSPFLRFFIHGVFSAVCLYLPPLFRHLGWFGPQNPKIFFFLPWLILFLVVLDAPVAHPPPPTTPPLKARFSIPSLTDQNIGSTDVFSFRPRPSRFFPFPFPQHFFPLPGDDPFPTFRPDLFGCLVPFFFPPLTLLLVLPNKQLFTPFPDAFFFPVGARRLPLLGLPVFRRLGTYCDRTLFFFRANPFLVSSPPPSHVPAFFS